MDLSPLSLMTSLVVGSIGFGLFIFGKKQGRPIQLAAGVALMVFPYFAPSPAAVISISIGIGLLVWLAVRAGF